MTGLIDELSRRKVFRVAVIYTVIAWLLIQVADIIFPSIIIFASGVLHIN